MPGGHAWRRDMPGGSGTTNFAGLAGLSQGLSLENKPGEQAWK